MDIIEIILVLILGLVIGWRASARVHLDGFRELMRMLKISDQDLVQAMRRSAPQDWHAKLDLIAAEQEQTDESAVVINVRLEQMGDVIYAYRKSDDQFLAQGLDADTLIARLNETMTSCRIIVAKEDGADLLRKNNT